MDSHTSNFEPHQGPVRWGILGAARIARKAVAGAIAAAGGQWVAVAASSLERAQEFARDFSIPYALDDYQALLDREDIDAVYIPLANGLHFRWALACARAGKHCLCEKPLVLTADEARQLRDAFALAGTRLLEGFMWRHKPSTAWLEEQLRNHEIGMLRRLHGSFSFALDRPEDYRWRDDQGGGALWDIGCYMVNAARLLFFSEPACVSAQGVAAAAGAQTDRSCVGWLDFGQDQLATFECSFSSAYSQSLTLTGDKGTIRIEQPFSGVGPGPQAVMRVGEVSSEKLFDPCDAYQCMVEHFEQCIRDESMALLPGEDGVAQAQTMQALAESVRLGGIPQRPSEY